MRKRLSFFLFRKCPYIAIFVMLFLTPSLTWAFMDEDLEKPRPEFSTEGNITIAKLVPRAKSSSVTIDFEAIAGGKLAQVKSLDFKNYVRPEVDKKDFKSELFAVEVRDVVPGAAADLSISSSFFSSSTYFWIFNDHLEKPWMDSKAENIAMAGKVRKFVIRVKDGGPFDSDGVADGKITVIGGPRDSFWGYVLGTLFIRFFGVFIVLAVLMIGMIISGLIFQKMQRGPVIKDSFPVSAGNIQVSSEWEITPEMAAAIGLALSVHLSSSVQPAVPTQISGRDSSAWALDGRRKMMSDRGILYNRIKR